MTKKAIMGIGLAIATIGAILLFRRAEAAPPEGALVISLANAPAGGDHWQILVASGEQPLGTPQIFIQNIDIDKAAVFVELPTEWVFPSTFDIVIYRWIVVGQTATQIYRAQSFWGPDTENYYPVYILGSGSFIFDCAAVSFEEAE